MLELLHDGHQGINRCKALARESVWWPGINNQIETLVSNCHTCAETRVQRSEPMLPSTTPSLPWEEVGIDLFHLNGQDFVHLVDYRSRFPEVISLRSTTALAVINAIKSVFARHGIPRLVRSDNGPQFIFTGWGAHTDRDTRRKPREQHKRLLTTIVYWKEKRVHIYHFWSHDLASRTAKKGEKNKKKYTRVVRHICSISDPQCADEIRKFIVC